MVVEVVEELLLLLLLPLLMAVLLPLTSVPSCPPAAGFTCATVRLEVS